MLKIMGQAAATVQQMQIYIKKVNPKVSDSVIKMIPLYISEGAIEGVRGDIAFAQSCLETGNFTFSGSAVTLDQNNFCGRRILCERPYRYPGADSAPAGIRIHRSAETDCRGFTIHLCDQRMCGVCGISRNSGESKALWMGCRKELWK